MRGALLASVLALAFGATSAGAYSGMPSGTFSCSLLMAPSLTGTSSDQFVPSVIGTFSLNGTGGYTRQGKSGAVVLQGGTLTFTSGEMQGFVAVAKTDPRGRLYLHVDGNVTTPPPGNPKPADFVCYQQ